jgi:ELWxxDGT repeat protein
MPTEPGNTSIENLTNCNGELYFTFRNYFGGQGLWRSDGTAAGTVPVEPGPDVSNLDQLTVVGDRLYFTASDTSSGNELWALDLTPSLLRGDLNCDGSFNGADIDPFFLALGDPAAYAIAFPDCDPMRGDVNRDGVLNGTDIDPFFDCLGAGGCP